MKIQIITVGKLKSKWIQSGVDHYAKLNSKYADIQFESVKESDSAAYSPAQCISAEAERIRKLLDPRSLIVLLDANGKSYDSVKFAEMMESNQHKYSSIQFVIGGAFGLHKEFLREHANHLSLSAMTFPHELTIVVLLEQLYRAFTISAGGKYHK